MFHRYSFFFLALTAPAVAYAQAAPPPEKPVEPEKAAEPNKPPKEKSEAGPGTKAQSSETDDVFSELESQLSEPKTGQKAPATPAPAAAPAATGPRGGQTLNPDISMIADFAAAVFSDENNLQGGDHDPTRTGFNLQALELDIRSVVDPYFKLGANLNFGEDGVELEEAYGTTLDLPAGLQFRFGKFLTRFGRLNASHPHSWDFVDMPFALSRVFGGEGNRGLGFEASILLPLPWYVELVGSVTHADGEGTARSFDSDTPRAVDSPADLLYVTAIKQSFDLSADWTLLWGFSGAFGPNSTGEKTRTEVYGSDIFLKYRPITAASYTIVSWQTEVLYRRRQVPADLLWDLDGYTQLFWRFARRWGTAARYEFGTPAYSVRDNVTVDPLDPDWTDMRYRVAANVTHYPSEFSRLRLQGSSDLPGWRPKPIWSVVLAAELAIGAHGAHPF